MTPRSEALVETVISVLHYVYDPEIPVNIYELGLIREVNVKGDHAEIVMTLTSPACPVAESLPVEVRDRALMVGGIETCNVKLSWDPPWSPNDMSEAAKLQLNM